MILIILVLPGYLSRQLAARELPPLPTTGDFKLLLQAALIGLPLNMVGLGMWGLPYGRSERLAWCRPWP